MFDNNGLIESLHSLENANGLLEDDNDDLDLGAVLDMYGSNNNQTTGAILNYADGTKKSFSFDN